jgi:hypothetical protein
VSRGRRRWKRAERGADQVDAVVAPGSGEHFFDLAFTATDFNGMFNELLYAGSREGLWRVRHAPVSSRAR